MKLLNQITALAVTTMLLSAATTLRADDKKDAKAKPYTLEKCVVSDEKLGEMGKPFVFTYEGQEIKLCCKSCEKDFKKDPAKYLKKIKAAEADKAAKK